MRAIILAAILAGSPVTTQWSHAGSVPPRVSAGPEQSVRIDFPATTSAQTSIVSQEVGPGAFTCQQFRAKWISGPIALRWAWTTYGADGERRACDLRKGEWVWCSACSAPRAK